MKNLFLCCLLAFNLTAFGQNHRELKTNITDVTVFLQGAQITRTGKISIPSGESTITVSKLSPYIDAKSLQVKAEGNYTVLSVKHSQDYLTERENNPASQKLLDKAEELSQMLKELRSRLEVLSEKESLLDKNKNLNGEASLTSLTQLKQAIEFYDKELSQIKKDHIQTNLKIEELTRERLNILSEISDLKEQENLPTGKIEISLQSEVSTQGAFSITYMVANAGWYPNYDLRVKNIQEALTLQYKADVYQNTGIDWNDVKLKFSNANPNQSGMAPQLETWYLNYPRNTSYHTSIYERINPDVRSVRGTVKDESGLPLPGVNVVVKGSSIGTQTDFDGNYELALPTDARYLSYSFIGMRSKELPISHERMDVLLETDASALDEVVVTGMGIKREQKALAYKSSKSQEARQINTTTIENQTTVEFEVEKPYTVPSNGEKLSVNLKEYAIDAKYQYYAVPKLDSDAFLLAKISDWDRYNLLEGEVNLFFENSYVGRAVIDARSLSDTLEVSLGRDRSIVIGREKLDQFSKKRTLGSNKIETREFRLLVRNKKSSEIELNIYDQIPVPAISDISVEALELTNGELEKKTGTVSWSIKVGPQEQKELFLKYEVKYPKPEKLLLE